MAQYFPKAWVTAKAGANKTASKEGTDFGGTGTKIVAKGTQVKARIDMGENTVGAGLCPECREPLSGPVHCNGHQVLWCSNDRIALPYKDEA